MLRFVKIILRVWSSLRNFCYLFDSRWCGELCSHSVAVHRNIALCETSVWWSDKWLVFQMPDEPLLMMLIGICFVHIASQKYSKHRHSFIVQGLAFLQKYAEVSIGVVFEIRDHVVAWSSNVLWVDAAQCVPWLVFVGEDLAIIAFLKSDPRWQGSCFLPISKNSWIVVKRKDNFTHVRHVGNGIFKWFLSGLFVGISGFRLCFFLVNMNKTFVKNLQRESY